jgi:hypothetical protein
LAGSADEEAIGLCGRHASGPQLAAVNQGRSSGLDQYRLGRGCLVSEFGRERLDGLEALAGIG